MYSRPEIHVGCSEVNLIIFLRQGSEDLSFQTCLIVRVGELSTEHFV